MSKLKTLAGETALYGLGSILPKSINFFLIILHTRIFHPEEYGVYTYLFSWVAFVNIVFTFGMETAFFRFCNRPGADPKNIFNLVQTIVLSISLPISLGLLIFASPIAGQLHAGDHPEYIRWITWMMLIDAIVAVPFAKLRLEKRPLRFAMGKILNILIVVALNLVLLNYHYDSAIGIGYVLIANLIGNSFFLFFFASDLLQWRPAFSKEVSGSLLRYSFPVMIGGLAWGINELFSRTTLEWWLPKGFYGNNSGSYALGIFAACYKLAVLMNLAVQAFRFAAEPFFFSNAEDKSSPKLFARVNHYFVIVCCIIFLGVALNLDILKYLIDEKYWPGITIVPVLLMGYLFLGLYYNFSIWYKLTDKTYYGTVITILGAVLTVLLNYLLIPVYGYMGSSWATFIVYFFMAAACYFTGQRNYPIPYRIGSDGAYLVSAVVILLVASAVKVESSVVAFIIHNTTILLFIFVAFIIEKRELWMVRPSGKV